MSVPNRQNGSAASKKKQKPDYNAPPIVPVPIFRDHGLNRLEVMTDASPPKGARPTRCVRCTIPSTIDAKRSPTTHTSITCLSHTRRCIMCH